MKVIHVSAGQSPLMGCLFALGILIVVALLVVGAGFAALVVPLGLIIWRVVRFFLPAPASAVGEVPEQGYSSTTPGVIDVEATVLPPLLEERQER